MIKKMKNIGMYAFLILVTFISVFPLYWMVSASTNKSVDVAKVYYRLALIWEKT